ncbi:hypothetical protein FB451DRAFT_1416698 [Mycena latifolia]|nr:hypothetical protein FB451DRAFT_1416698 [Mycena latifolia]
MPFESEQSPFIRIAVDVNFRQHRRAQDIAASPYYFITESGSLPDSTVTTRHRCVRAARMRHEERVLRAEESRRVERAWMWVYVRVLLLALALERTERLAREGKAAHQDI